jgi:hypothetical protein
MTIVNDATSWSIILESSMVLLDISVKLLESSVTLLESSVTLLESTVTLLENIYCTGMTHDDRNMFIVPPFQSVSKPNFA